MLPSWHAQVWDLKDLGLQAAQRVLSASDPLRSLMEMAQNFPAHAGPLSRQDVRVDLRMELASNRRVMQVEIFREVPAPKAWAELKTLNLSCARGAAEADLRMEAAANRRVMQV